MSEAVPYEQVPGPRGWPVVGILPSIQRERFHQQLEDWARHYGGRVAFRIGPRKFLAITNPEAIGAVLRDRPENFRRSQRLEEMSRQSGFGGVFSANGDTWRRQRPMVLASLDPAHIRHFFPTLVEITQRLGRRWEAAADAGTPIDLQADLTRYTVDTTTALALGEDVNTIESTAEKTLQTHLNVILPLVFRQVLSPFRFLAVFRWRQRRRIDYHLGELRRTVDALVQKARRELAEQPQLRETPVNLLQAMVAKRDADEGLTDNDLVGNALTMLLAGEDTTANTIAWMVWLLHRNPAALLRATEEARSVLRGAGCPQTIEQIGQLPWIEACAHEALRLKPVAPMLMNQAAREIVVDGVRVPAGTMVIALVRPPGIDPARFPQPEAFAPERWLQGGEATTTAGSTRRATMPFGAGPRMCPGRYLALAEVKMVVAMLLANFEVLDVSTVDGAEPEERIAMTMFPVGLRMKLKRLSLRA